MRWSCCPVPPEGHRDQGGASREATESKGKGEMGLDERKTTEQREGERQGAGDRCA